jgi:hypothetical protein
MTMTKIIDAKIFVFIFRISPGGLQWARTCAGLAGVPDPAEYGSTQVNSKAKPARQKSSKAGVAIGDRTISAGAWSCDGYRQNK